MDLDATSTGQSEDASTLVALGEKKTTPTMPIPIVYDEPVIVRELKPILAATFLSVVFRINQPSSSGWLNCRGGSRRR